MDLTKYTESPGGCRKRKREYCGSEFKAQKQETELVLESNLNGNGILNTGFTSSTPNSFSKSIGRSSKRLQSVTVNKEKIQSGKINVEEPENPFEVTRRPPAKKKRPDIKESCFENAALNLDAPERAFNPFEIRRILSPVKEPIFAKKSCFVNNGLDIRVQDTNVNPYEVTRLKTCQNSINGITNPALDIRSPSAIPLLKNIAIALPFQPTTTCRIDFQTVPLESLLEREFVTSGRTSSILKNSLSAIVEDDEIDIGKELDCYQLELENSINEAKLKKANIEITKYKKIQSNNQKNMLETTPIKDTVPRPNILEPSLIVNENGGNVKTKKEVNYSESDEESTLESFNFYNKEIVTPEPEKFETNDQEKYDSNDSNASSIYNRKSEEPTPFVRCYRKPLGMTSLIPEKKDNLEDGKVPVKEMKYKIGTAIRKSIRKIIAHSNKKAENENNIEIQDVKEASLQNQNIFKSIRQSLRRKPFKTCPLTEQLESKTKNDISIIDCTERTKVFRSPKVKNQTKDLKTEILKNVLTKNKYTF